MSFDDGVGDIHWQDDRSPTYLNHSEQFFESICCGECGWDDACEGCCQCFDGHKEPWATPTRSQQ